jgi:hypothetical protein
LKFPEEIFNSEAERELAVSTIRLAQKCGSAFVVWTRKPELQEVGCYGKYDQLITNSFNMLKDNYIRTHPFQYYIIIPFQNLMKTFLKFSLQNPALAPSVPFAITMLFRSFFLLLGLFACWYYRRIDYVKISFLYWAGIVLFVCFILRQVEMRYLFQADILMLLMASVLVADKMSGKRSTPVT